MVLTPQHFICHGAIVTIAHSCWSTALDPQKLLRLPASQEEEQMELNELLLRIYFRYLLCMSLCANVHLSVLPMGPKEGIGSLGTLSTDCLEPPNMDDGN